MPQIEARALLHGPRSATLPPQNSVRLKDSALWACLVVAAISVSAANSFAAADNNITGGGSIANGERLAALPAYPLKVSANNRFLVDQHNVPFLMVGDAPQTLIANLSEEEADSYMRNRSSYGINTLWINLLCNSSDGCDKNGATFDGIAPFLSGGDLSVPNEAYFERADRMINIAASHGMLVLLDPIETTSWLSVLRANGTTKAFAYGQYLGARYKNFPNIIWMHGNDFQSWEDKHDDALVQAVARGIRSTDSNHIHTVELNYLTSGSLDDPSWAPLIELNAAYTYFPTYAQVLTEYKRRQFKPVFMVEANYEFEHNFLTDGGSPQNLRRQEYWTMLSGAAGQVYGSAYTWRLEKGWQDHLDTPGVMQLSYMRNLFVSRRWWDLIPDQDHTVAIAGYDGFSCFIGHLMARLGKQPHLCPTRSSADTPIFFRGLHNDRYLRHGCANRGWLTNDRLSSVRTIGYGRLCRSCPRQQPLTGSIQRTAHMRMPAPRHLRTSAAERSLLPERIARETAIGCWSLSHHSLPEPMQS